MPLYRVFGLTVLSDFPLPGVLEAEPPFAAPDIHVRRAAVPARLTDPLVTGPFWQVDRQAVLLSIPEIGSLLARDGQTLDVDPAAGLEDLLPFAMGTGMAALLYQRGNLVLHAATVAINGRAVLLCGKSGLGKSTLAATLCRQGGTLISDDLARITLDGNGQPQVWPDGRMLKLYPSSIQRLALAGQQGREIRPGVGKYYVAPPTPPAPGPLPVAAAYALTRELPGAPAGIRQFTGLDRAQALLNWSYRHRLAMAMARTGRTGLLTQTVAMQDRVPLFRLTRPQDLAAVDDLATGLLHHLQSLPPACGGAA